ncbi:MAG: hypothetical protein ACK5LW_04545 [Pseudanabaena sp.]|jgi:hypothetical protein
MSSHTSALVPLETWAFSSPDLHVRGLEIDIGLFAESLIYYDTVYVVPSNPHFFSLFLKWFADQEKLDLFTNLVNEGVIKIYDYSFMTTAIEKGSTYSIWNVQDEVQAKENVFERRYLHNVEVEKVLPSKSRHRKRFYEALRRNVVEVKADSFEAAVEDARRDFENPDRSSLIIQALIDELYAIKKIAKVPEIKATVNLDPSRDLHIINWNINFTELSLVAGFDLKLNSGSPLTANAHSNRFIWSASSLGADLFLPRPMSQLVGDKLFESVSRNQKLKTTIESLHEEVEFPSIRKLVNTGKLKLDDVIEIRRKAVRFRKWLQQESDRDRKAIIAYHNELAQETGLVKHGRTSLKLLGILGGGAIGGAIGSAVAGPVGGAVGGLAGSALNFTTDVCSKVGADWKPVVFGNWLEGRIKRLKE